MSRVLLADPDPVFARGLQLALEQRELVVETIFDGQLALTRIQLGAADVCVLDTNLRGMEPLTILRKARASGVVVPIVVMAGDGTSGTRVTWFDAGADDVVGKPFDPDELAIRLKTVDRRSRNAEPVHLSCGPLKLDVLSGTFLLHGELMEFTPREHSFLKVMISRPGYLVPRDRAFRVVFGENANWGAMDVLACRLRRKLSGTGVSLNTVRGMGFMLDIDRNIVAQPPLSLRLSS